MKEIKKIKIFTNKQEKSEKIKLELETLLKENNFELVNDNPDLSIAIGGDGSFLKMVNKSNFNSETYYIGINTGNLGFLQEIKPNELELFVNNLKNNPSKPLFSNNINNQPVENNPQSPQNIKLNYEKRQFQIVFPPKYHNNSVQNLKLVKQDITEDGKIIKTFENGRLEIFFPSGLRKEIFPDGYQVTYFVNKHIMSSYYS